MIRRSIVFSLRPPGPYSKWRRNFDRWMRSVLARFPKDFIKYDDPHVDLSHPQLGEFVDILRSIIRERTAVLHQGFRLVERLEEDAETRCEWFRLEPETHVVDMYDAGDGYLQLKGTDQPRGVEVLDSGYGGVVVGDRFRKLVEERRWRDISFLQVRDSGRFAAPSWHLAWSDRSLGRAIRDPWSGPIPKLGLRPLFKFRRVGDPVADELLRMFAGREFFVDSFDRVLKSYLPHSRFACLHDYQGSWLLDGNTVDTYQPGAEFSGDGRRLFVRRDVKQALVDNRLARDSDFQGVMILDDSPKRAAFICVHPAPVVPLYSKKHLATLRAEEARIQEQLRTYPKPRRKSTLKRSLALLRACRRAAPDRFRRAASARQIAALKGALEFSFPASWEQVLRTCDGGRIESCELACDTSCEIIAAAELPAYTRRQQKDWPGLPEGFLPVVDSELGDTIGLDTRSIRADGECGVLLFDHESSDIGREWPTVAEFLEDLLTVPDAESEE